MALRIPCSIPGCKSSNETHKMYKFPSNNKMFKMWKQILQWKFPDIKFPGFKGNNRCQKYVCRLHFEDKYIDSKYKKDRFAIPTLFTEEEIATKTPERPMTIDIPEENYIVIRRMLKAGQFTELDHPYSGYTSHTDFNLIGFEPPEISTKENATNEDKVEKNDFIETPDLDDNGTLAEDLNDEVELAMDEFIIIPDFYHTFNKAVDQPDFNEPPPFSWQNTEELVSVEDHIPYNVVFFDDDTEEHEVTDTKENVFGLITDDNKNNDEEENIFGVITDDNKNNDIKVADKSLSKIHRDYYCDICMKEIIRYTCVQCDNFDLCCACERKRLHPEHYMLRVPGPKPYDEVKNLLEALRIKINILMGSGQFDCVAIKEEEDEWIETESVASQDVASEARMWTPTEQLGNTRVQGSHSHTLRAHDDQQEQNVPDVSDKAGWHDEAVPERDKQGPSTEQVAQDPSHHLSLVPERDNAAAENLPSSEHFTLVDPLSLGKENFATQPKLTVRTICLCRSETEVVSLGDIPVTSEDIQDIHHTHNTAINNETVELEESHSLAINNESTELEKNSQKDSGIKQRNEVDIQDTYDTYSPAVKIDTVELEENHSSAINNKSTELEKDSEIQQQYDEEDVSYYECEYINEEGLENLFEIWYSDSIPTKEKVQAKHKPSNLLNNAQTIKYRQENQYIIVDSCITQTHTDNLSEHLKRKTKLDNRKRQSRKTALIGNQNLSDDDDVILIIDPNVPDDVSLESVTETHLQAIAGLEFKANPKLPQDKRLSSKTKPSDGVSLAHKNKPRADKGVAHKSKLPHNIYTYIHNIGHASKAIPKSPDKAKLEWKFDRIPLVNLAIRNPLFNEQNLKEHNRRFKSKSRNVHSINPEYHPGKGDGSNTKPKPLTNVDSKPKRNLSDNIEQETIHKENPLDLDHDLSYLIAKSGIKRRPLFLEYNEWKKSKTSNEN